MWIAITVAVIALIFTIVCLIIVLPSTRKPAASSSHGGYSDNVPDASGLGVCYGADRPSHNDMVTDFQQIKDAGFSIIRTYFPAFYNIPVTDAAAEVGIKVLLGWPWKDPEFADNYKQQIIDAVTTYPDTVWGVCVGNEDTTSEAEASKLIAAANELKSIISGVPVGTAQKSDQVLDSFNTLDFVGVNIYPYFSSTAAGWSQDANANANSLNSQISNMKDRFGDKLVITESGLPSAGPGIATPSGGTANFTKDIQKKFFDAVNSVEDVQIFWFEAFNESNKPGLDTEKYYGIL